MTLPLVAGTRKYAKKKNGLSGAGWKARGNEGDTQWVRLVGEFLDMIYKIIKICTPRAARSGQRRVGRSGNERHDNWMGIAREVFKIL